MLLCQSLFSFPCCATQGLELLSSRFLPLQRHLIYNLANSWILSLGLSHILGWPQILFSALVLNTVQSAGDCCYLWSLEQGDSWSVALGRPRALFPPSLCGQFPAKWSGSAASKTHHLIPAPRGRSRFIFSFQLTNLFIHTKSEVLELPDLSRNFLTLRWTTHNIHRLFLLNRWHTLTSFTGTFLSTNNTNSLHKRPRLTHEYFFPQIIADCHSLNELISCQFHLEWINRLLHFPPMPSHYRRTLRKTHSAFDTWPATAFYNIPLSCPNQIFQPASPWILQRLAIPKASEAQLLCRPVDPLSRVSKYARRSHGLICTRFVYWRNCDNHV